MDQTTIKHNKKSQAKQPPLAKKLLNRLKCLSSFGTDDGSLTPKSGQSMYAGDLWELAGGQYAKLEKRGFVEARIPHNLSHKTRAVITQEGLDFLAAQGSNPLTPRLGSSMVERRPPKP